MIIYDDDGIGHDVVPMSVIEDIKAEIQATIREEKTWNGNINKGVVIGVQMALDIIDKHISGKE